MSTAPEYIAQGMALVPIPERKKRPIQAGWNRRENAITTTEQAVLLTGNIGLAHAYCQPVYDEIAFSPLPTSTTTLNYWAPSPVVPKQGDWLIIRQFLLEVICGLNIALYRYLILFLAHMLQKPGEKPGVLITRCTWPPLRVGTIDPQTGTRTAKTRFRVAIVASSTSRIRARHGR